MTARIMPVACVCKSAVVGLRMKVPVSGRSEIGLWRLKAMRQYTFWQRPQDVRDHLRIPAWIFFLLGLGWAALAYFETIPERSALKTIAGQVETVTRIDTRYDAFFPRRYDLALKTDDGRAITAKLDQSLLGARETLALHKKPVVLQMTSANWIMAINSGGRDILTYDRSRRHWEDDIRFRLQFGLGAALLGLLLGAVHVWKSRADRSPATVPRLTTSAATAASWKAPKVRGIPTAIVVAVALGWIYYATHDAAPPRSSLRIVGGIVESITRVEAGSDFGTSHYAFRVRTSGRNIATVRLALRVLPDDQVRSLHKRYMAFEVDGRNWVVLARTTDGEILSYEQGRKIWDDEQRFYVVLGAFLIFCAFLTLAIVHLRARRCRESAI